MTPGHREAQQLFLEIGQLKGYRTARTYSDSSPTDGIWFAPGSFGGIDNLPFAALEVAASESPKTWKGSIATIEEVSPTLGILLLQDDVMRARLGREGWSADAVEVEVQRVLGQMRSATTKQRIKVMNMAELRYLHRVQCAAIR